MWGVPRLNTWRTRVTHRCPRAPPWWQALRAIRPPIEKPKKAISFASTGHASITSDSIEERRRPFSDTCRLLL